MSQYVHQVMSIYSWTPPSPEDLSSDQHSTKSAPSGFGPAVSRPRVEEEEGDRDKDTPFGWVKDNQIKKLNQWIAKVRFYLMLLSTKSLSCLSNNVKLYNVPLFRVMLILICVTKTV